MNLKLSQKLYAATGGVMAILLALVTVSVYSNRASQSALNEVFEHTVKPLLSVQSIDRNLQEVRLRVAAVTLGQVSVEGARNHLKEAREAIPAQWKAFLDLNRADTSEETELVKKIGAGLALLPPIFDRIDKAYAKDDRKLLETLMEEDWPPVTKQAVRPLAELIAIQSKQMGDTYDASTRLGSKLTITAISVFAAGFVLLLVGAVLVVRSIAKPIRAVESVLANVAEGDLTVKATILSRDEIGAMAESVNATVGALNATLTGVRQAADKLSLAADALASEATTAREESGSQTDRVMEISAAMQELTVSVAEIAGRAKAVSKSSEETRAIARSSAAAVGESTDTTRRALHAVTSSSAAVGELSAEIEKISAITQVIKEIANQTNLLALNAAIEAARAGESGRGFAVVADEVRKLAERTTASTVDITRMIAAIQGKAETAVTAMSAVSVDVREGAEQTDKLHQSFDQILEASEQLTRLAAEIAEGTTAQDQVAQQTARSMEVIAQIAERTGNSVDHVAAAAEESAATAQNLKELIGRFRVA